jgi:chemotaxis methyl-accepting protein methylase
VTQPDPAFEALLEHLKTSRGFDFTGYKRSSLMRRVDRRMAQVGITGYADYLDHLELHGDEFTALFNTILINVTGFFRDPEAWEYLSKEVLPGLLAATASTQPLRVWSAGCASGEEAYSLTMLFADEGLLDRVHVVATDISRAAIERGRAACYRDWSFRALDTPLVERHFRSQGRLRVVNDALRKRVVFKQLNLATDAYPSLTTDIGAFALVFCRNVLMFLDSDTIAAIAGRLYASLLPGGWLITGPSDPNLSAYADFEVHLTPAGLMYQRPLEARVVRPLARLSSLPPGAAAGLVHVSVPPIVLASEPALLPLESFGFSNDVPLLGALPVTVPDAARDVRAAWNQLGAQVALALCSDALTRSTNELELHHLHALLLWELQRVAEAAAAMRRVLYLDRSSAIAHFGLAALLERLQDPRSARRSYLNVLSCCEKLAPELALPLGDGISVAGLRSAATRGLARIEAAADGGGGRGSVP